MDSFKKRVLALALKYIDLGFKIFPAHTILSDGTCSCGNKNCDDAGKHPATKKGLKDASNDPKKIDEWFGESAPARNICIATGEISGITVIDVDVGEGKNGEQTWIELNSEKGEPDTLMSETGSGGMHVFFQYNSALKTSSNTLGEGIDVRNDGGYIIAPPSKHKSGNEYVWENFGAGLKYLPAHLSRKIEKPKNKNKTHQDVYSLTQIESMLEFIPADDRDVWRNFGVILGRVFNRIDGAWDIYVRWADKANSQKGRNHDEIMREAFYEISQKSTANELSIGTIVKAAIENGWSPKKGDVPVENFIFFAPSNQFVYRPTGSYWVASAVDYAVSPVNKSGKIIAASEWLKTNMLATSMTCNPAIDNDYLKGHDCRDGEIIETRGSAMYNTYRKSNIDLGDASLAKPFIEHVERVFNKEGDAKQFLDYMAHRVQQPWVKPRFALLLAGAQGVGKDTAFEFCCPAIGPWNVANIDPSAFDMPYNEYMTATIVRISEAANLHDLNKWAFNERTKVLIAGSPDVQKINPKYGQKFTIKMHCGVIITTNHLASGIYIPPDDRRYDVIEAATLKEMGLEDPAVRAEYFGDLWDWFHNGGANHVAAFLHERDVKGFNPNAGQRKTIAYQAVVSFSMAQDTWLIDILDDFKNPDAIRVDWIINKADEIGEKKADLKRKVGAALIRLGYKYVKCPATKDGRWRIEQKRTTIYIKEDLDPKNIDINSLNKEFF